MSVTKESAPGEQERGQLISSQYYPSGELSDPPITQARGHWIFFGIERVAALLLFILLSPLITLVALAVKLESPFDPIFYRQERVGKDRRRVRQLRNTPTDGETTARRERRTTPGEGQPFMIWKFRTMVPDAEAKTGPVWASEDDPRITRVGRMLRYLRLDELPQLINVFLGQMRLIGPRPERGYFIEELIRKIPDYRRRLSVPPGITGLAQVERHYDSNIDDVRTKIRYDVFYVENRSKLMDIKILIKTIGVVLRGRGAR